jgi:hypothetical protein
MGTQDLYDRVSTLDLSVVDQGACIEQCGSSHVVNEAELEYRRLLLISSLRPSSSLEVGGTVAVIAAQHLQASSFEVDWRHLSGSDKRPDWAFREQVSSESATGTLYRETFGRPLPLAWRSMDYAASDPIPSP